MAQAYGIVWRAVDKKSKTEVALKKIFDAFQNKTDAQRTYREIFYLQRFIDHPNIIKLINVHRALNSNDIYLIFEYMGKSRFLRSEPYLGLFISLPPIYHTISYLILCRVSLP